jgi:Terpene synthase family 2, C-terminal metal binding
MLSQKSPRATSSLRLMLPTERWPAGDKRSVRRDAQGPKVVMPPLSCPFDWAEDDDERVDDGLWQWLDRCAGPEASRLRQAMRRHGAEAFVQRVCSRSSTAVGQLQAAYFGLLYLFDEGVVNNPNLDAAAAVERIKDTLAALDGRPAAREDLAFVTGVLDVLHEAGWIDRRVTSRIHRHTRSYLLACQWEILSRARPPSLSTYVKIRRDASAVFPCLDFSWLDFATGGAVGALDGPLVLALETMANDVISWSSDVIGMSRDFNAGVENLVTILRRERRLDWQGAMNAAADMCDAEVSEFVAMRENLGAYCGPELRPYRAELDRYVEVLGAWMSGAMATSPRSPASSSGARRTPTGAAPPEAAVRGRYRS